MSIDIKSNRLLTSRIIRRRQKPAPNAGNRFSESLIRLLPFIISVLGVLVGLFQYSYNQYINDLRKYNLAYYDERYKILKSTAQTLSEIDTELSINLGGNSPEYKDTLEYLVKQLNKSVYYSYLYLNPSDTGIDLTLINKLKTCNSYLKDMLIDLPVDEEEFRKTSMESMQLIGDILRKEKDEINTFNYSNFFDTVL